VDFVNSHPNCVPVMYHAWWPGSNDPFYQHNIGENRDRINHYGIPWVPFEYTDGVIEIDYPPTEALFQAAYDARMAVPCNTELALTGTYSPLTRLLDFTIDVTHHAMPPAGDLFLHVVLTESELFYNAPNGVDWHEFTMRDMIPDAAGVPITLAGGIPQTDQYQASLSLDPLYDEDHCTLVFFLQNHSGNDVMQAGMVQLADIMDMTGVESSTAPFALAGSFPNPFNPRTSIRFSLDRPLRVELEIYDLDGGLVERLVHGEMAAGDHSVDWLAGERPSGVYLCKLKAGGHSETRKMTLLK